MQLTILTTMVIPSTWGKANLLSHYRLKSIWVSTSPQIIQRPPFLLVKFTRWNLILIATTFWSYMLITRILFSTYPLALLMTVTPTIHINFQILLSFCLSYNYDNYMKCSSKCIWKTKLDLHTSTTLIPYLDYHTICKENVSSCLLILSTQDIILTSHLGTSFY